MIREYLADDHARLDLLMARCVAAEVIPYETYDEFRRGLLRHIGIEERLLFPVLRQARGATALEDQLHRDHAAIAALLVPPPARAELVEIVRILETHNPLEENGGGLYDLVDDIVRADGAAFLERVKAMPDVPTAPHSDTPLLRKTIAELLAKRL